MTSLPKAQLEKVINIMVTEKTCVILNENGCDRNCSTCHLVLPTQDIVNAYNTVIGILTELLVKDT